MPYGTNASQCVVCGKHFLCGDCITFICHECSPKLVPHLVITCPDEHGPQSATTHGLMGIKLSCGCVLEPVSMEGGWIRSKDREGKCTSV